MRRGYLLGGALVVALLALWIWHKQGPSLPAPETSRSDNELGTRGSALTARVSEQDHPPLSANTEPLVTHETPGDSLTGQDETAGIALDPDNAERRIEPLAAMLEKASTAELQTTLRQAFDKGDDILLNAARNHLLVRAKAGDAAATAAIVASVDAAEHALQEYLVRTLGEIATTDALSALIDIARHTHIAHERAVRAAIQAIAEVGQWRDENVPAEELSALLEQYFSTVSPRETETFAAVARGLSSLGTARGVHPVLQMLDQLQREGSATAELRSRLSEALTEVRNPDAVSVLASRLQEDPGLSGETSRVAGTALAAMGDPQATRALLDWAAGITDQPGAEQALTWLSGIRDQPSLELLLQSSHRENFHNAALKQRLGDLARELSQRALPKLSP